MHWLVDTHADGARAAVAAEIERHLQRHCPEPDLVALAAPIVTETADHLEGEVVVSVDWTGPAAVLRVACLPPGSDHGPADATSVVASGVQVVRDARSLLPVLTDAPAVEITLGATRPPEPDIDPIPDAGLGTPVVDARSFLAASAAVHAGRGGALRRPEETAALLGASLAATARRQDEGPGAAAAAETFLAVQRAIGGSFLVEQADDQVAVLVGHTCPYGDAVLGAPALCRTSSALAGRLAAQGVGATITLAERLALGDDHCRLVIDLRDHAGSSVEPTSHRYEAEPVGWAVDDDVAPGLEPARGFRIALSLRLPRDLLSVPLARRLTRHALNEAGVVAEDVHDVELALTEATGNVLDHAGLGDVYDVTIEVLPDRCDLRVVDVGRGFDHADLTEEMAATSAEQGRGVALMHALMDQVRFASEPEKGTVVHLVKKLDFDDDAPTRRLMLASLASLDEDPAGP